MRRWGQGSDYGVKLTSQGLRGGRGETHTEQTSIGDFMRSNQPERFARYQELLPKRAIETELAYIGGAATSANDPTKT